MRYRAYLDGITATVRGEDDEVELEWTEFGAVDDADAWARARNMAVSQGGSVSRLVARPGRGEPDRELLSPTDPQVADVEETEEGDEMNHPDWTRNTRNAARSADAVRVAWGKRGRNEH